MHRNYRLGVQSLQSGEIVFNLEERHVLVHSYLERFPANPELPDARIGGSMPLLMTEQGSKMCKIAWSGRPATFRLNLRALAIALLTQLAARREPFALTKNLIVLVASLAIVLLSRSVSFADQTPLRMGEVWAFPHQGIARFCYEETPAVVYLKYDPARRITSVLKKELSGVEHVLGEFTGAPNQRSLSCSQDGRTLVALGIIPEQNQRASLFVSSGSRASEYLFVRPWLIG